MRIKELRTILGLSQQEFARKLSLKQPIVSLIEKSQRRLGKPAQALLQEKFAINLDWLQGKPGAVLFSDIKKGLEFLKTKIEKREKLSRWELHFLVYCMLQAWQKHKDLHTATSICEKLISAVLLFPLSPSEYNQIKFLQENLHTLRTLESSQKVMLCSILLQQLEQVNNEVFIDKLNELLLPYSYYIALSVLSDTPIESFFFPELISLSEVKNVDVKIPPAYENDYIFFSFSQNQTVIEIKPYKTKICMNDAFFIRFYFCLYCTFKDIKDVNDIVLVDEIFQQKFSSVVSFPPFGFNLQVFIYSHHDITIEIELSPYLTQSFASLYLYLIQHRDFLLSFVFSYAKKYGLI